MMPAFSECDRSLLYTKLNTSSKDLHYITKAVQTFDICIKIVGGCCDLGKKWQVMNVKRVKWGTESRILRHNHVVRWTTITHLWNCYVKGYLMTNSKYHICAWIWKYIKWEAYEHHFSVFMISSPFWSITQTSSPAIVSNNISPAYLWCWIHSFHSMVIFEEIDAQKHCTKWLLAINVGLNRQQKDGHFWWFHWYFETPLHSHWNK